MTRSMATDERQWADRFLEWLKANDVLYWPRVYDVLVRAAADLDIEIFNLHKAVRLLRVMGRIELNNPNGQKGAHVVDTRPLSEPARPSPNGGLVVLKLSDERLAEIQDQIDSFRKAFPNDVVVFLPLDAEAMIGDRARSYLIRLKDEIDKVLKNGKAKNGR